MMVSWKSKREHLVLFPVLLVFYEVVSYLSNDAYLPALPLIANAMKISNQMAQLCLTLWFLGTASVQPIVGPLADRYGRRPVLLFGCIAFIVATFVCATTQSISVFLTARFIQGATVVTMVIPGYSTIHELFDQKKAIHVLAWMNSITVLAPSVGPLMGAMVLFWLDWRWIFWLLLIGGVFSLVSLWRYMPETCTDGKSHPIEMKEIIKTYWRILSNKGFMSNSMSFFLLFGAMIAWIATGPFLVLNAFGYRPLWFGIFQIFVFGSFVLATRSVSRLMNRFSVQQLVRTGLRLSLLGGALAVLLAHFAPRQMYGMIVSLMVYTAGAGLCFPILNRLAIEASEEPMGSRMAMFSLLMALMGVLGSTLVGFFYNGELMSLAVILLASGVLAVCAQGKQTIE